MLKISSASIKKRRNVLIVLVVMWGHSVVLLWLTQGNLRLPSGHWPPLLILVLICKCICLSNLNVITNATWLDEANKCARTTSDGLHAVDRVGCFSIFFLFKTQLVQIGSRLLCWVHHPNGFFMPVNQLHPFECQILHFSWRQHQTKLRKSRRNSSVRPKYEWWEDNKAMTESSDTGHSGTF